MFFSAIRRKVGRRGREAQMAAEKDEKDGGIAAAAQDRPRAANCGRRRDGCRRSGRGAAQAGGDSEPKRDVADLLWGRTDKP